MILGGFQKLTLLDYPGKVACTLFTKGCNFRCPFCHNSFLVTQTHMAQEIPSQEILSYLKKRQGILEGVCITGGEPLLQPELETFIKEIKALGFAVKLDTNGAFPEKLKDLAEKKLIDYVAMDIKSCPEKYSALSGCEVNLEAIKESVHFLIKGQVDYEFRTTVADELHTVEDIRELAKFIEGAERYFLQNFADSGNIIKEGLHPVGEEKLKSMKKAAEEVLKCVSIR